MIEVCRLRAGQWVLITAASSAVGLAAIQIAQAVGARPIATILGETLRPAMLDAGAQAVITDREDMALRLQDITGGAGLSAAFDAVGGPQVTAIAEAMQPRGAIVIHGALSPAPTPYPLKIALRNSLTLRGYVYTEVTENTDALARAIAFAQDGVKRGFIAPRIDSTYPLDRISDAHERLESGQAFGKIVLIP